MRSSLADGSACFRVALFCRRTTTHRIGVVRRATTETIRLPAALAVSAALRLPAALAVAAALAVSAALVLATACAPRAAPATPAPPAAPAAEDVAADPAPEDAAEVVTLAFVEVAPLWETVPRPEEGFAGLDVWPGGGQRPWLVVAAAASHRLVIVDAGSGELLRELGALGERPGSFREPVDVAVAGDLAFVVERGNARVQVVRLPGLATAGFLGEGELERPAAVAVEPAAEGWTVWVAEEAVVLDAAAALDEAAAVPSADAGYTPPPLPARAVLHRLDVGADGSLRDARRLDLDLGRGADPGRVAGLAVAPDGGGLFLSVASASPHVFDGRLESPLGERPVDVLSGAVAGAEASPCGGGWIVALPAGGLLAVSPDRPHAGVSLALDEEAVPVAVAVARSPLSGLPAGTLYAVTADSRLVAVGGAELAAAFGSAPCP
jgi:hypothetical protein